MTQLVPIVGLVVYASSWLVSRLLPNTKLRMDKDSTINTTMQIAQLLYITLTTASIKAYMCYNHPENGLQSMMKWPSQLCWEGSHVTTAVLAAFFCTPLPSGHPHRD